MPDDSIIPVIRRIDSDRRSLMSLLLIGDESEPMVERYLESGQLFAGFVDGKPVAICLVTEVSDDIAEVKNLAVLPEYRRRGVGRAMLRHAEKTAGVRKIILGTGETPSTLRFYRSCGYTYDHVVYGFFRDNYDHPIVEEGVTLCDMIYLSKILK